jgi:hypothetical protein
MTLEISPKPLPSQKELEAENKNIYNYISQKET